MSLVYDVLLETFYSMQECTRYRSFGLRTRLIDNHLRQLAKLGSLVIKVTS